MAHHLMQAAFIFFFYLSLVGAEKPPSLGAKYRDYVTRSFNAIYIDKQMRRHEFIFNTTNVLIKTPSTIGANGTEKEASNCRGYHACHLIDGKFTDGYTLDVDSTAADGKEGSLGYFESKPSEDGLSFNQVNDDTCQHGKSLHIYTQCRTHWHPPMHLYTTKCRETFEWHSPYACDSPDVVNEESACYTYDQEGQLISLIPLIKPDGSGYHVDTSDYPGIEDFNVNVCFEAHKGCGPDVSACYTHPHNGSVEAGYNHEPTEIVWNPVKNATEIIYLGQRENSCKNKQKIKTIIRFICPSEIKPKSKPKLVSFSSCESVIEWHTMYACPESMITSPNKCSLILHRYNINIDIQDLTDAHDQIDVPDVKLNGSNWTMKLGICKGLSNFDCAGKQTNTDAACLVPQQNSTTSESKIVGSTIDSTIKLIDDTVVMEYPTKETCLTKEENYHGIELATAQKLSTRIEFYCDPTADDTKVKPKFNGFQDCSYVFSWPSRQLCKSVMHHEDGQQIESPGMKPMRSSPMKPVDGQEVKPISKTTVKPTNSPGVKPINSPEVKPINSHEVKPISSHEVRLTSGSEVKPIHATTTKPIANPELNSIKSPKVNLVKLNLNGDPDGNRFHRIIMISLILISFILCVIVIVYLNARTRLTRPLNNFRTRNHQTPSVPYRRVANYGENGDL